MDAATEWIESNTDAVSNPPPSPGPAATPHPRRTASGTPAPHCLRNRRAPAPAAGQGDVAQEHRVE